MTDLRAQLQAGLGGSYTLVDAAGGAPRILVRFDDARPSSRLEFATDGRRFYFTVTDRVSDIWTMELKRGGTAR